MARIGEECAIELFDRDLHTEIEVGDEVENETETGVITAIRTDENGTQIVTVMNEDGLQLTDAAADAWKLTGRHFSELTRILQNIGRFG